MLWSDHLVHPALRTDAAVLLRARLTVRLSVVLMGVAVAYALVYGLVIGYTDGAWVLATGAGVGVLALAALRLRPWLRAGEHLLPATLYGVVVALMVCEGGVRALATPLLALPPMLAVLLLGRRWAGEWTVLGIVTIAAFGVLEYQGVRFPPRYPAAWAARMAVGSPVALVLCTALLLSVVERMRAAAQAQADAATAALRRLAYHDPLTGLANRAQLLERLTAALDAATAAGDEGRVAMLVLDLDGFKPVNDTLGHAAGDALLVQVGARLLRATRGCDMVARLGGDEFGVLLDGVHADEDMDRVAARIVGALSEPFGLGVRAVRIGTSVGMARASAATPDAAAAAPSCVGSERGGAVLLHAADIAMYRAKALGRGRWVRYAPGMSVDRDESPARPPVESVLAVSALDRGSRRRRGVARAEAVER